MAKASRKASERRARKRSRKHRAEVFGLAPEGRLDGPTTHTLDRRAEKIIETIIRYPELAVQTIGRDLALQQYAGTIFGRLQIIGAIDWQQRLAGEKFTTTLKQYRQGMSKYLSTRTSNFESVGGGTGTEDLSPAALKRFKRIQKRYDYARDMLNQCGEDVEQAVMNAVDREILGDLALIKAGLDVLSRS